jgi:hypothetical protein
LLSCIFSNIIIKKVVNIVYLAGADKGKKVVLVLKPVSSHENISLLN